jgi:acetoin utilization protein AcuB
VGIITDRDLREASPSPATTLTRGEIAYQMATTPIKTCMTTNVVWISPDMTMVDAAWVLMQCKIDCLPVVDHGALVGVVTAIDCVRVPGAGTCRRTWRDVTTDAYPSGALVFAPGMDVWEGR